MKVSTPPMSNTVDQLIARSPPLRWRQQGQNHRDRHRDKADVQIENEREQRQCGESHPRSRLLECHAWRVGFRFCGYRGRHRDLVAVAPALRRQLRAAARRPVRP
jgi:hypothetical protein